MTVLSITLGDVSLADMLPWRDMQCAPRDRAVLLYSAETGEMSVGNLMTSMVDGDEAWIIARGLNEDGQQVAFHFRDPVAWTDLPKAPVLP